MVISVTDSTLGNFIHSYTNTYRSKLHSLSFFLSYLFGMFFFFFLFFFLITTQCWKIIVIYAQYAIVHFQYRAIYIYVRIFACTYFRLGAWKLYLFGIALLCIALRTGKGILSLQYVYFSIVGWRIFARYFSLVELAISSNVETFKEKSIGFIAIYVSQHRYLYHRVSICVFVFVLCLRGRQLGGHRHVPRLPETIHPLVLNAPSLFQTPLGTIIRWVRELSNLPTVDLKSSPKLAYTVKKGTEILFLLSDNVAVYCKRVSLVWDSFFQRIVKREKENKKNVRDFLRAAVA